jgi:hypothetical protein
MLRVLVLIGAFLFFRAVLPRTPRWSSTRITPYMSALDGMMSARQVSALLDEVSPYDSWLNDWRRKIQRDALHEPISPDSTVAENDSSSAEQHDTREKLCR